MDAKQSAIIEYEDYNKWCIDNERPADIAQSLIDYCKEFNIDDDVYYEMCAIGDPVELSLDKDEDSSMVSQDDIDERLGNEDHELDLDDYDSAYYAGNYEDNPYEGDGYDESFSKHTNRFREHNDKDKINALAKYVNTSTDGIEETSHENHIYKSSKGSYSIVTSEEGDKLGYDFEDAEAKQGKYYFFKK